MIDMCHNTPSQSQVVLDSPVFIIYNHTMKKVLRKGEIHTMAKINDPDQALQERIRRGDNASRLLTLRIAAVAVVLYMLYGLIQSYIQGGADAPTLWQLILAIVLLGGGGIAVGLVSYRSYKRDKADGEAARAERKALAEVAQQAPAPSEEQMQ